MPQNEQYYYAAYAIVAVTYALYALSVWRRARALEARARGDG
jgi:hypothetical protein